MKKIRLQSLPQGQILSNEELKSVVGGITATISCVCSFKLSNGSGIDYGTLPLEALESESSCALACGTACASYRESGLPKPITCEEVTSSNYNVNISY